MLCVRKERKQGGRRSTGEKYSTTDVYKYFVRFLNASTQEFLSNGESPLPFFPTWDLGIGGGRSWDHILKMLEDYVHVE